jgi:hypothetical protein
LVVFRLGVAVIIFVLGAMTANIGQVAEFDSGANVHSDFADGATRVSEPLLESSQTLEL